MDDSDKRPIGAGFLWPGVIVTVLGLSSYLGLSGRLETVRPKSSLHLESRGTTPDSVHTAYARLWEDPLGPTYRRLLPEALSLRDPVPTSEPGDSPTQTGMDGEAGADGRADGLADGHAAMQLKFQATPLVLPVFLPGGPSSGAMERRMRIRYAILSALTAARYRPLSSQYLKHLQIPPNEDAPAGTTMPMIVPYERFAGDRTDRIYDSEEDDPEPGEVLVLWVDEDQLGDQPLHALQRMLGYLLGREEAKGLVQPLPSSGLVKVRILGPSGTDLLITMAGESEQAEDEDLLRLHPSAEAKFYGCRATVEPAALKHAVENSVKAFTGRPTPLAAPGKEKEVAATSPATAYGQYVNVVGTDWHLASALRDELVSRGRWPTAACDNECLVLLTDKDTSYGRSIPFLFSLLYPSGQRNRPLEDVAVEFSEGQIGRLQFDVAEPTGSAPSLDDSPFEAGTAFEGTCSGNDLEGHFSLGNQRWAARGSLHLSDSNQSPPSFRWSMEISGDSQVQCGTLDIRSRGDDDAREWTGSWRFGAPIVVYHYLRGIDGRVADEGGGPDRTDAGGANSSAVDDWQAGFAPTGSSQLDYLRRLETQLVALHRQQRQSGGRGILAVGVMGTDVYDKLLILRALRGRFPGTVFFTTDLDAEFARPSELRYTRNLIVASHFGLQLHPSLQRDVAPFRESYQTADFLGTLLAVDEPRVRDAMRGWAADDAAGGQLWPVPRISPAQRRRLDTAGEAAVESILEHPNEWFEESPYSENQVQDPSGFLRPLIFEIGRNGPYQLTITGRPPPLAPGLKSPSLARLPLTTRIHPPSPRDVPRLSHRQSLWLGVCVVAACGLSMLYLPLVRQLLLPVVDALLLPVRLTVLPAVLVLDYVRPEWLQRLAGPRQPEAEATAAPPGASGRWQRCWTLVMCDFCGAHATKIAWLSMLRRGLIFLVLSLTVGWLCWVIYQNHFILPEGEPFEWGEGVSVWPSTLIRGFAAVLCLVLMFKGMDDLRRCRRQLFGDQADPAKPWNGRDWFTSPREKVREICLWNWKEAADTADALQGYVWRSLWQHRVLRSASLTAAYFLFAFALFSAADDLPNSPARNAQADWWSGMVLKLSVLLCILLVFFVIDATFLCRRFVGMLGKGCQVWPADTLQETVPEIAGAEVDRQELATIRVIARQTNQVGKLLLYPFSTLLLLILARNSVFDGWSMPLTLVVIIGVMFLALILHSLALRRAAMDARRRVLQRLRGRLTEATGADEAGRARLEQLIADVKLERDGAFRPLADDYLFRALAIPFGGTGGLLLLEHFIVAGW